MINLISLDELKIIANKQKFNLILLEKDYLLTYLLYLIKDVEGIYFKGGTALNKIFLNHERLSEDLDFTLIKKLNDVEKDIRDTLKETIFKKITHDKRVEKFIRLIVHYKLFHEEGTIFIDLNQRAEVLLNPKKISIPHFYSQFIPDFEVNCLDEKEIIAEKIMATCERYKPRDYFDLYNIIKNKLPISIGLIKKKFKKNNKEFTIKLLFKKTNKIYNEWNEDLFKLTKSKPSFNSVMDKLKEFFRYKHENQRDE